MENDGPETNWKERIQPLRNELLALWSQLFKFREEKKLTLEQVAEPLTAFNRVFDQAGYGLPGIVKDPENAVTYALFRDGIHQLRSTFAHLHPELVDEFNRAVPANRSL
ncbi:MAG: hypothetical protein SFV23_16865 [Planctomycetaceae bacterium]|nr:hypothetical protein [Planctomycetaceae bacterium]